MVAFTPTPIPTPRELRWPDGPAKLYRRGAACRILICGRRQPQLVLAARMVQACLHDQAGVRARISQVTETETIAATPCDVVLCGHGESTPQSLLPADLTKPHGPGAEQGYLLHSAANTPVLLWARQPIGALYAAVTLLQLFAPAPDGVQLRNVVVADSPAFRWRGNNWSLFGEIGGWSYERGDGRVAFEARARRQLDLCLRHKINLVIVDGLGWSPARSPGYAAMMRRLNQTARLRGIHLLYTGYGSGYGCPVQDGIPFRNRRTYPDGEIYPCCGSAAIHDGLPRTMGTCLSNRELLALKQRELATFVRRIEPGALYIHNLDESVLAEAEQSWPRRCEDCRRQWPRDDVLAADGLAGAMAWFYDRLADAVNEVRNPRTGYEARRDCLLMMVSPNYSDYSEDDRAWQRYLRYWATVGLGIHHPNVLFGLREQYCNDDPGPRRFAQLRQHLDDAGVTVPFGTIAFTGGDGYFNNLPFIATPVLTGCFAGADLVLYANGNGYQEPQQLLNAEYCWNPDASAFHRESLPDHRAAWWPRYLALSAGTARPGRLFGRQGFLEQACRQLYGAQAGSLVAQVYRLQGRTRCRPLGERFDRPSVLLPVWNTLMPAGRFSTFRRLGICWRPKIDAATWDKARLLGRTCAEMAGLNLQGARLIARAVRVCDRGPEVQGDLAWLGETLGLSGRLAAITAEYLRLMPRAYQATQSRSSARRAKVTGELTALNRRLRRLPAALERPPVDHLGGDVGFRREVVVLLSDEVRRMQTTLRTGEWLPSRESTWW